METIKRNKIYYTASSPLLGWYSFSSYFKLVHLPLDSWFYCISEVLRSGSLEMGNLVCVPKADFILPWRHIRQNSISPIGWPKWNLRLRANCISLEEAFASLPTWQMETLASIFCKGEKNALVVPLSLIFWLKAFAQEAKTWVLGSFHEKWFEPMCFLTSQPSALTTRLWSRQGWKGPPSPVLKLDYCMERNARVTESEGDLAKSRAVQSNS